MDELDDVKCWRQGTMTVFCQPNVIKKKKLDKDTADKTNGNFTQLSTTHLVYREGEAAQGVKQVNCNRPGVGGRRGGAEFKSEACESL